MKLGTKPGLAAGLVVLALAAPASALAGPTVRVRVEGASGTLLERTTVTLPDTPALNCASPGTVSAAIEVATGGNWDHAPEGFTETVLGETHASLNDYWAEWVDRGAGYKLGNGVCNDVLNTGDEVLMLDNEPPYAEGSTTDVPLELHVANGVIGADVPVYVTGEITTSQFGNPGEGTPTPVAGATVSGGGASVVTDAAGRAVLRFSRAGTITLKAAKPGTFPSAAETIQIAALQAGAPVAPVADRAAPAARLLGIRDHQVFAKGKGPRTLRARAPDPSGLAAVKLRLTRRAGGRCSYFSGRRAAFERTRCGRAFSFKVGTEPSVSYLLPRRLGPGRYVLDLTAVDRAGNRTALARGTTRVVFTVR